jgi:hypothetical protein
MRDVLGSSGYRQYNLDKRFPFPLYGASTDSEHNSMDHEDPQVFPRVADYLEQMHLYMRTFSDSSNWQ